MEYLRENMRKAQGKSQGGGGTKERSKGKPKEKYRGYLRESLSKTSEKRQTLTNTVCFCNLLSGETPKKSREKSRRPNLCDPTFFFYDSQ